MINDIICLSFALWENIAVGLTTAQTAMDSIGDNQFPVFISLQVFWF
jgi:hypothetical protein